MEKLTEQELLTLILKVLNESTQRLDSIESSIKNIEELFYPKSHFIESEHEQLIQFSKELYVEICEYCGNDGISFMGIA